MKIKTEGSTPGRDHPGDREVGTVTYTPYKDSKLYDLFCNSSGSEIRQQVHIHLHRAERRSALQPTRTKGKANYCKQSANFTKIFFYFFLCSNAGVP